MYFRGEGVPKDDAQAVSFWKKAAAQDHATAQNLLGQAYSCGLGGLTPDKEKAEELFQRAKEGSS
jgi:TPR repeat protein